MSELARIAVAESRSWHVQGMESSDLAQEALIAAWKAEQSWRPGGSTVEARVRVCVRSRLRDVLRDSRWLKRFAVTVSLDEALEVEDPRANLGDLVEARDRLRERLAA